MAFTVEDGTGLDDSNSYASVAEFDAYFTDRANSAALALSDATVQACLIKATDYIDQRFGARFIGTAVYEEQALAWPRDNTGIDMFDFDEETEEGVIPVKLKYACIEYALRANDAPLAPDPTISESGVAMVTTMQKAGPVEQRFATAAGSSNAASVNLLRPYPGADMYLRDLLVLSGNRTIR
jgi:hypothetical protein